MKDIKAPPGRIVSFGRKELRELYQARAVMFQSNAELCYRVAAENVMRGFYNAAIYWQIAGADASRMARKCVERLNDG